MSMCGFLELLGTVFLEAIFKDAVELTTLRQPTLGCLRSGLSWFNWWVSFALDFQCWYFCESSCLFYLGFNFDFYVYKIMHL